MYKTFVQSKITSCILGIVARQEMPIKLRRNQSRIFMVCENTSVLC